MNTKEIPAILGGTPVRSEKIYYGRQWINEDDVKAVGETLLSDYITTGPKTAELEQVLCSYTGAKYATAVSNGTAALHLAALAAGIGEGDEVITTALTFMASANCALYCGAKPVFADVDPNTYNIDPRRSGRRSRSTRRPLSPWTTRDSPAPLTRSGRSAGSTASS